MTQTSDKNIRSLAAGMAVVIGLAGAAVLADLPPKAAFAGDEQTITRDVSGFDTIRLSGSFVGNVVVGDEEGMTITGDGKLEDRIVTEVKGDELHVRLLGQGQHDVLQGGHEEGHGAVRPTLWPCQPPQARQPLRSTGPGRQ